MQSFFCVCITWEQNLLLLVASREWEQYIVIAIQ